MMRKKVFNSIIGALFIAGGLLYALDALNLFEFKINFDGWWTLFIIVPFILSIINNGLKAFNVCGLGIGVILLLNCQDIITNIAVFQLIAAYIVIIIGFTIIFKRTYTIPKEIRQKNSKSNNQKEYFALFGGNSPQFAGLEFDGCDCYAIFGAIELFLNGAFITKDCVINSYSIFGGSDIFLPPNVKAIVSTTPIFGGADNKFISSQAPDAPTVYINAVCIFGGLDIK